MKSEIVFFALVLLGVVFAQSEVDGNANASGGSASGSSAVISFTANRVPTGSGILFASNAWTVTDAGPVQFVGGGSISLGSGCMLASILITSGSSSWTLTTVNGASGSPVSAVNVLASAGQTFQAKLYGAGCSSSVSGVSITSTQSVHE